MFLSVAIEECLSVEHIQQAAQAACQYDLAWGIVLAFCPPAQASQEFHLFPLQRDTQFIEEASSHPGQGQERTNAYQV
jgi:hypothetical protein